MIFAAYLLVGAMAGVLAGLFGVGGGTIIVPALVLCLKWQGAGGDLQTHIAVGTSLATIVLTSLSSTWTHHRAGAVHWPLVRWLTPGLLIGVWLGAGVAAQLSGLQLQRLFGLFAWAIAAQMAFNLQPAAGRNVPGAAGLSVAGGVIGFASALFGIGGGSLTVPFLHTCRVRMQEAVATAAACGFPIALGGAISYLVHGWHHDQLPEYSAGFIYLPALLGISVASLPCARFGARLAHRWSAQTLKRVFAGFLVVIGTLLLTGL